MRIATLRLTCTRASRFAAEETEVASSTAMNRTTKICVAWRSSQARARTPSMVTIVRLEMRTLISPGTRRGGASVGSRSGMPHLPGSRHRDPRKLRDAEAYHCAQVGEHKEAGARRKTEKERRAAPPLSTQHPAPSTQ